MLDLDSLLVSLYVLTDDWWKATHYSLDTPQVGRPSLISEPEILTLAILAQWPRFRSERDFLRFACTWPDPVFCTRRYESVSTDSNSSGFPPSSTFLSRPTAIANSAGVR